MQDGKNAQASTIIGVFRGFAPGSLFRLSDNTYWLQTDSASLHAHTVSPAAAVLLLDDGCFLKVTGQDKPVEVIQLHDVIESRIRGRFTGWNGKSVYTLTNGQRWQQARFKVKQVLKYKPKVLIYNTGKGHMMQVAGTLVQVRRLG